MVHWRSTSAPASSSAALPMHDAMIAPALRRLTKARRHEIKRLRVHVRAKHYLHYRGHAAPFTVYAFAIDDRAHHQHRKQKLEWVLAKRFSECYDLRCKLAGFAQLWERTHDANKQASGAVAFVTSVLQRPGQLAFPRRHVRCDSDAIVRERCVGLYDFVRCLLGVYADIYVHVIAATRVQTADSDSSLRLKGPDGAASPAAKILYCVYLEITSFLNVPAHRQVAEARHAATILTLEDCSSCATASSSAAETTERASCSETLECCICFEDGSNATMDDGSTSGLDDKHPQAFVRLPCGHAFHEDCVIAWFCTSATCPLCRQPPTSTALEG